MYESAQDRVRLPGGTAVAKLVATMVVTGGFLLGCLVLSRPGSHRRSVHGPTSAELARMVAP
jgi:hypothetical protein